MTDLLTRAATARRLLSFAFALVVSTASAQKIASLQAELATPVVQSGHADRITTMAFSADNSLLATGSVDGMVKLWSPQTGRLIKTFAVSRYWVFSVAFSPNAKLLAVGSGDHSTYVFDFTSPQPRVLGGVSGAVTCVAFSEDGRFLASGASNHSSSDAPSIKVQDVASGKSIFQAKTSRPVGDLVFIPRLNSLAGVIGTTIQIWNLDTQQSQQIEIGSYSLSRLTVSADSSLLAVSGADITIKKQGKVTVSSNPRGFIRVFHILSGNLETTPFLSIPGGVALAFTKDNGSILGLSAGQLAFGRDQGLHGFGPQHVMSWSIPSGAEQDLAQVSQFDIGSMSQDGSWVATSTNNSISFLGIAENQHIQIVAHLPVGVRALDVSSSGKLLAVGLTVGTAVVWDLEMGYPVREFVHDDSPVFPIKSVGFTGDGGSLYTVSTKGSFLEWNIASAKLAKRVREGDEVGIEDSQRTGTTEELGLVRPSAPPNVQVGVDGEFPKVRRVSATAISRDGAIAYAGVELAGYVLNFVSIIGPKGEFNLPTHAAVSALGFSPLAEFLAIGYEDGKLELWDAQTWTMLDATPSTSRKINAVRFSFDGMRIAAASEDGTVRVWQTSTQRLESEHSVLKSQSPFLCVAFSPDGSLLAAGAVDSRISTFNFSTGAHAVLEGHTAAVTAISFLPKQKLLVSGSEDATVKFWNADANKLLSSAASFSANDWLTFSPEGFFDGTRRAWQFVPFTFPSAPLHLYEPEQFFNEFYEPGMLADVVATQKPVVEILKEAKDPRAALTVSQYRESELPLVRIVSPAAGETTSERTVTLNVEATDTGSGLRDLRVFRNQSLIAIVHGELKPLDGHKYLFKVPVVIAAGANQISAYAFNDDNLKSKDASVLISGDPSLRRQGKAYILAVGINHYSNEEFDLHFAEADAGWFAATLGNSLKQTTGDEIVAVPLLNQSATRANIVNALQLVAGDEVAPSTPEEASLHQLQPEDTLIFYFSGHGTAREDHYYLLPHDLGYTGHRRDIDASGRKQILDHSFSDTQLEEYLERMHPGRVMIIIDACQSGQLLESTDKRRGPLNTRGVAQLAYDKGAFVLAAAQSYQSALELSKLGHGVLTYVLVQDGLLSFSADIDPVDGKISASEWIKYATTEVPIESRTLLEAAPIQTRKGVEYDPLPMTTQAPTAYYPIEDQWVIRAGGVPAQKNSIAPPRANGGALKVQIH